ncbi:MAG: AEC family transporter [Defluviitaleaceae bacterium]|nr:AEC family transporter [Defluviitaleaceae bacterium]
MDFNIFFGILTNSILPIFILVSLGFALDKKFNLDINALTKLNFYLFVPAFSFVNIFTVDITVDLAKILVLAVLMLPLNYAAGFLLARLLKLPKKTGKAFENSLMFYNSGNIGISLVTLVFTNAPFADGASAPFLEAALAVQVMVLLVQNFSTNTLGFINSGGEGINVKTGVVRVLKMPVPYAIACAILFKFLPFDFSSTPFWPSLSYLRNGLVGVALSTLGVQLAKSRLDLKKATPYIAALFRLVGGPALAFALIKIFKLEGVAAKAFFISAATPTAVNTALLSVECGGDVDFAVQAVTISTLLSALTMTAAVYLAHAFL